MIIRLDPAFLDPIKLALIAVFCVFGPLAVLVGRRSVRRARHRIIENLQELLRLPDREHSLIDFIPSFEIAKRKYESDDAGTGLGGDFLPFLFPAFLFAVLSAVGFLLALNFPVDRFDWASPNFFLQGLQTDLSGAALASYQRRSAAALSAAFIGAYIWSVQYLIRRLGNYDLSPISFLRATSQIILAGFTVSVVRHLMPADAPAWLQSQAFSGLAFLMGFYPLLGLNYLIEQFPQLRLKRADPAAAEICRSLPLDTIDGIDHFIQFRLAEREIEDVQVLATANPILMFIETPYGLLQIIDWVAQAQLLLAVGPGKFARLRDNNVRTIFDLARSGAHPITRERTIRILLGDDHAADDAELFHALYGTLANDLHVRRLVQLWNAAVIILRPAGPENMTDVATLNQLR